MHVRLLAAIPAVALIAATVQGSPPPTAEAAAAEQVSVAADVRTTIESDGRTDFVVEFEERADLRDAESIEDWGERGTFVVDILRDTAKREQAEVVADLSDLGATFTSYWINNSIIVHDGDDRALSAATSRPEVASVTGVQTVRVPDLEPKKTATAAAGVEWGVADVGAHDVWSQAGVHGEGIVVGTIDSGVQYDHPALAASYRGRGADGTFNHDHHWFDPTSVCDPATPCDTNGHGTHTMGTIVGDDGNGNQIGVAPGATWISAKGCEGRSCDQSHLLASGQWMLAPTDLAGENAEPALRPHIVNNSWGGSGTSTFFRPVADAWRAAGMFPVFSNGNTGPECETVGAPATFGNTIGVGAYDRNGVIAPFSSRGPSVVDGGTKPNISAPGVDVRSSVPGSGYALNSGTSMAAPHVAGAVALVWSRSAALRGRFDDTAQLLDDTARDVEDTSCGGDADDNNVWGEGKLDALAAVLAAPAGEAGRVTGVVSDEATGEPVPAVTVTAGERRTQTDAQGRYAMVVDAGDVELTAKKYAYHDSTRTLTVPAAGEVTVDIVLSAAPTHTVTGIVRDGGTHGWPIYAQVEVAGRPDTRVHTDPVTGGFRMTLPEGEQTLAFSSKTYLYPTSAHQVTVEADTEPLDIALDGRCEAVGYDPTSCESPPRYGLVVGHVRSAADGAAVDGAEVRTGTGSEWESTDSAPTPDDPALDDGFFRVVATPGTRELTVSLAGYPTVTVPVDVVEGEVVRAEVDLDEAIVTATADGLDAEVAFGEAAKGTVTLTNSGTAETTVTLAERARLDDSVDQAELTRIPVELTEGTGGRPTPRPADHGGMGVSAASADWEPIAPISGYGERGIAYPGTAVIDGIVYGVGGLQEIYDGAGYYFDISDLNSYDPATDTWTRKQRMNHGRGAPAVAVLDGRIFAAGGQDWWVVEGIEGDGRLDNDEEMAPGLEIYDPVTDSWEERVGPPKLRAYSAGVALDGQFYVVGGCDLNSCDNGVFRYDPAADAWSEVAEYPTSDISGVTCGALDGAVYCAGGIAGGVATDRTFRYDPAEDGWTEAASLPTALTDSAGTVANGQLMVSGGLTHAVGFENEDYVTNEGYAYDPGTDTWSALPPAPRAVFGAGAACGMYRFGGWLDPVVSDYGAEWLPGLDSCGTGDLPWMSLDRTEVTLEPGETATVQVRLDSAPLAGPSAELGSIAVVETTPRTVLPVPVTLRATESRRAAAVEVSVAAIGRCEVEQAVPAGAQVTVETRAHTRVARADADGTATVWVMPGEGRVTVTATAPGHQPASVDGVRPTPREPAEVALNARQAVPCATVDPDELAVTVAEGSSATVQATLGNTGSIGYDARIAETPATLRARAAGNGATPGVSTVNVGDDAPPVELPPAWHRMASDYPDTGQNSGIRMVGCDGRPDMLVALDYVRGFALDAGTGVWDELPRFKPVEETWTGTVAVCDVHEIHLLGYTGYVRPVARHLVYDLNTGQVRRAASMPGRTSNAAVGIWDGRIFLAGGYPAHEAVQVYDTATDRWAAGEPMPVGSRNSGFAQQGHHLYVIGGVASRRGSPTAATYRLDMITGEWERGPDLDRGRWDIGLVATDTAIYALGGQVADENGYTSFINVVDRIPTASWPDGEWERLDPLPQVAGRPGAGCTESLTGGAEIWSIGGQIAHTPRPEEHRAVYVRPVAGERCDTMVSDVPWLSSSAPGMAVEPGDTATLELTVDASSLEPGTHHATVLVRTNDPGATEVRMPITVTVTAAQANSRR